MWINSLLFVLFTVGTTLQGIQAYVEALAGNYVPPPHSEPQIAMVCGKQKYYNQYFDETGHWVSDMEEKAVCTKDKVQILEYCRKVYPKKDITNIVESSHYFKIENWCRVGQKKCKGTHWVKPYRCLEGPFQSDALLVPEHCLFDHIHNQSKCQGFDEWNRTAAKSCLKRDMQLRSFAMLLPCGIDVFSGVEFVCCPRDKDKKDKEKGSMVASELKITRLEKAAREERKDSPEELEDNESASSSSEEDEDIDDEPQIPTTTPDYYFSHFDAKREHEEFKAAEKRLEDNHREKVTKVMKDWSELEERYQEMKAKDPKGAEAFKKKMTARFQKTVAALEEEGAAEKKQLVSMHQQRVMAHINEKKKEGMECYTKSLNMNNPKAPKVQKCLEKLLRALEKDRTHTMNHYKHLLNTNLEAANREKATTLEHLGDIDRMLNQSIEMLERIPEIATKIREDIMDYLQSLRGSDDPLTLQALSQETEEAILEKYKAEISAKQQEKQHQKDLEKQRKQELKFERQEKKKVVVSTGSKLDKTFDPVEDELLPSQHVEQPVKVAHAQSHDIHHNEVTYSVKREDPYKRKNSSVYITLAFAGIALLTAMIVGIVFLRKRTARSPHNQGFVEVDQAATPEERHVANMQVNGYENPTYKYFEARE